MCYLYSHHFFFFFNDTATTEIYTLSLHDALPISVTVAVDSKGISVHETGPAAWSKKIVEDRKSTRLNSSHLVISYAVFCLKKKKQLNRPGYRRHTQLMRPSRVPPIPHSYPSYIRS